MGWPRAPARFYKCRRTEAPTLFARGESVMGSQFQGREWYESSGESNNRPRM